jgi:acyl dehydratase
MAPLYLEDLTVGLTATSGEITVTAPAIKAFAAEFDPQSFHLDEKAARKSLFGGLVASGWHTAAMTMRLVATESIPFVDGTLGAGIDELKWPTPVRPGDRLHIESEVIAVRPSQSKPRFGLVRVHTKTLNQDGAVVQSLIANIMVPRRQV